MGLLDSNGVAIANSNNIFVGVVFGEKNMSVRLKSKYISEFPPVFWFKPRFRIFKPPMFTEFSESDSTSETLGKSPVESKIDAREKSTE